ncbi:MAG TPA: tetratricopeptide repeat protein [Verrucomicrobiae bacterium]|nr:tetratricopeptide repeat protein [Verrucomicrobiae bacterium]
MPSRTYLEWLSLWLSLLLLAGCAAPRPKPAESDSPADNAVSEAATADYSSEAVKARVESLARYTAAIVHEQDDEPELAAEECYRAALADPSNEDLVLEATGRLLRLRPGETTRDKAEAAREKAAELLKKATARPNASGALFARLGLLYSIMGKKDLAIEANRKAIQKAPDNLAGYQYLSQLYLQHNQPDEGIKVLDLAARRPHVDASFLIELGETYAVFARGGKMEAVKPRAVDVFKRAAALNPSSPALLMHLADGFGLFGEIDRAVEIYSKLLERAPNLTVYRDKLVELYLRKQDRTNAAAQLRAVVRESPTNPQIHYLLGSILFEEHNPKEAAEYFNKTILLSPNFEPAYYDLAAAQINSDQPQEALHTIEKARDKFPESFIGEFYSALAYSKMKDYTNALRHLTAAEVFARVNETNRLTHTFYFQLGSAYERTQKFKEAETYFRKALDLAPDFAEALNYLGYMWAERGENLEEARRMIERAVRSEPKNAAFLDSLGWVLYKLDRPKEALKWLLQAVEQSQEPDPTLWEHLGDIYASLKQPEKAREAWRKSLTLEPNAEIEKKLKASVPGNDKP